MIVQLSIVVLSLWLFAGWLGIDTDDPKGASPRTP